MTGEVVSEVSSCTGRHGGCRGLAPRGGWGRGRARRSGSRRLGGLQLPACTVVAWRAVGPGGMPLRSGGLETLRSRPALGFPPLGALRGVACGPCGARTRPPVGSSAGPARPASPLARFLPPGLFLVQPPQNRGRPRSAWVAGRGSPEMDGGSLWEFGIEFLGGFEVIARDPQKSSSRGASRLVAG